MSSNKYLSPLCSCIICKKLYSVKGINTHYRLHNPESLLLHRARAIESSKNKDYTKNKTVISMLCRISEYDHSPNSCKYCFSPLSYKKRNNQFCNRSCSVSYENVSRKDRGWKQSDYCRQVARENNLRKTRSKRVTPVSFCKVCQKCFPGKRATCSDICLKKHYALNAKKHNLGELGIRQGKSLTVSDPFGNKTRLESSYETLMFNVLTDCSIPWCRPKPISYIGADGVQHKYYPDFYLPDYDIYLDPKNDYLIQKDSDKIARVIKQNNVTVIVVPKSSITTDFIKSICG